MLFIYYVIILYNNLNSLVFNILFQSVHNLQRPRGRKNIAEADDAFLGF